MAIEKIKTRIAELESWLKSNHPEHIAVESIQFDLRKAKQELAELENSRTYERDTFDIREHDFNTIEDERK